jgi:hypothetical protein
MDRFLGRAVMLHQQVAGEKGQVTDLQLPIPLVSLDFATDQLFIRLDSLQPNSTRCDLNTATITV